MSINQGSKFWGVVLTLGLTSGALFFLFAIMEESRSISNPTPLAAGVIGGAVFFALLRGPVGKAIARMLEGHGGTDEHLAMRVEQVEDRLAELGMDQVRVAELEERLDFAERLLAQREPAALRKAED